MLFNVSTADGVPIYQQIINQVKHAIGAGQLVEGDELPPIRKLAEVLLVNPNTIARAYRDLEREGAVTCQRGAGTHVASGVSPLSEDEKTRILADRSDALLSEAAQLGIGFDDLITLLRQRRKAFGSRRDTNRSISS